MAVLQCKNVGDEVVMKLAEAKVVEGNYGPQVLFASESNDVLYMPEASALRQLQFLLNLDAAATTQDVLELLEDELRAGGAVWLKFWRKENQKKGGQPYWQISRVGQGTQQHAAPPAKAVTPPKPNGTPARTAPAQQQQSQQQPRPATSSAAPGYVMTQYTTLAQLLALYFPLYRATGCDINTATECAERTAVNHLIEMSRSKVALGPFPDADRQEAACTFVRLACVLDAAPVSSSAGDEPPPPDDADKPADDWLEDLSDAELPF